MKQILLIEDDDFKAKDIISFLDRDAKIERQVSLTSGIRAIKEDYDFILLDMSLPRFNESSSKNFCPFGGIEILREIERRKIKSKIIVITQYSIFGEGDLKRTFEDIKEECKSFKVTFLDVIKYARGSAEWKEKLHRYL